ncbi:hypothetical protein XI06_14365 [Bradyrhizobium sp. CCBAU 11434]|uniref:branched-chain amino acid ABC transporter permease n=1 Tax=Bradyrhizobium sp. CCBAU 11434 TaxID=1630885 RepID=UPI002304E542|nr:branched-chain amino acid ABC transporter permease [Bradyrhizobium sp. CCBAU 11434]MDA9521504.1 hypothetical protein [Bradyrhizobium sp. CCBAU 11434]
MTRQEKTALAVAVLALALVPVVADDFWLVQIFGQSFALGLVALSLNFLSGYGGFVSMAQTTLAGCAGYMVALTSVNAVGKGVPLHPVASIGLALGVSALAGAFVGWISVRLHGVYMLMLTLALAMGFFFFAQQNVELFNAFDGIRGIVVPNVAGVSLRSPKIFFYMSLICSAAALFAVMMTGRSPFGLVLKALRDHPRKAAALGFDVAAHRIAAFAGSGLLAGCGGIFYTWFNQRISASTVGLGMINSVLIMAIIGGLRSPIGAFTGAFAYVLINTFASGLVGAERVNTLVGSAFVAVVLASPDGIAGAAKYVRSRVRQSSLFERFVAQPASGSARSAVNE